MTRRMLRVAGVALAVAFTVLVGRPSGQAPAARRAALAKPSTYTTPRTPWGDPDIQGTWSNGTITPLERPRGAGRRNSSRRKRKKRPISSPTIAPRPTSARRIATRMSSSPTTSSGGTAASRSAGRRSSSIPTDGRLPAADARRGRSCMDARAAARHGRGAFDSGSTGRCRSAASCTTACRRSRPATTTTTRSCRRPASSRFCTRRFTKSGSSRSTAVRTSARRIRQWLGDSRGHWDGDTLVVETTNFRAGLGVQISRRRRHARSDRAVPPRRPRTRSITSSPSRIRRSTRVRWTAMLPMRPSRRLDLRIRVPRG